MEERGWWWGLSDTILAAQPLFAAPIFFSILIGTPSLWLSWMVAVIPWGLRFWRTGRFTRRTPFDIPILIFVLGMLVGLVVSPSKAVSLEALHTYFACILIYYGIVNNSDAKNGYWISVGGTVCLIVLGLSIWFFSEGVGRHFFFNEWAFRLAEPIPKISGPIFNMHGLGAVLAVIIPVLLAVALFKNRLWLRLTALISGLGFLAVLFLNVSGGGWISVVVGLAFVVLCWRFWTVGLVLPAVGLGGWVAAIYYDKASWLAQSFSINSFWCRVDYWRNTVELLKDYPVTGCGLGTWREVYNSYYGTNAANPHNTYLQIYADTGALGAIALVSATAVLFRICWRILSSSRQSHWYGMGIGIIGGIVAGAAHAVVEVTTLGIIVESATIYHSIAIPLLWIWVALLVVAYNRLYQQPAQSSSS